MTMIYDLSNEYGARIIGDGGEDTNGVLQVSTAGAAIPALDVKRTAAGSQTIGLLRIEGSSLASGALMEFKGGFVSVTSILLSSAAHVDYVIPIQVGLETRYIPVWKGTGLVGGAAF